MERKIQGWLGVSYRHKDWIEVLGNVCSIYEGETCEDAKQRFMDERGIKKPDSVIFW